MRYLILLSCCLIYLNSLAQPMPIGQSYPDKVYYVSNLKPKQPRNDSTIQLFVSELFKLANQAYTAGDAELSYLLQITSYTTLFNTKSANLDSCMVNLEKIVLEAENANLQYIKAEALQALGQYNWEIKRNHIYAVEFYKNAYNIYKQYSGDEFPMKQFHLYTFAGMYYGFEDDENVIKYMKEALEVKPKKGDRFLFTIYNTIGLCYRRQKQYDSALYYFNIVRDYAKKYNQDSWLYIASGNIGSTYFYQGKYKEAKSLLQQDMETSLATEQVRNATAAMGLLGSIYFIERKYDSSEYILKKALEKFEQRDEIEIAWHSFQLDPDMEYIPGKDVYSYLAERKGQSIEWSKQVHDQVTQMAKDAGLEYKFDKVVINNSYTAHRFLQLAKKHGLGNTAEEALFKAYFTDGKNIGDHDTLIQLGINIGLGATEIGQMLNSDAFSNEVDEDIYTAQQYGIRGVPFFIINNKYAVSGAQPHETFLGVLKQAWSEARPALTNVAAKNATCQPGGDCY